MLVGLDGIRPHMEIKSDLAELLLNILDFPVILGGKY